MILDKVLISISRALLSSPKFVTRPTLNCIRRINVYQEDRSDGYRKKEEDLSFQEKAQKLLEQIQRGRKLLKSDIKLYTQELKEGILSDDQYRNEHGNYMYFSRFNDEKTIDSWTVTADSNNNEGKSTAKFELNRNRKGLFHGYLNTEVPKDGRIKRTGYCNIMSPLNQISFNRLRPYDWSDFTHMYLRVRGDGRNYYALINIDQYWDVLWADCYCYPIYTRGGPYWQTIKIPFSKFYFTQKGRVQDKQEPFMKDRIRSFGITMGDNITGPFRLEIDYIALVIDHTHTEDFAYELYETPKYVVGST